MINIGKLIDELILFTPFDPDEAPGIDPAEWQRAVEDGIEEANLRRRAAEFQQAQFDKRFPHEKRRRYAKAAVQMLKKADELKAGGFEAIAEKVKGKLPPEVHGENGKETGAGNGEGGKGNV